MSFVLQCLAATAVLLTVDLVYRVRNRRAEEYRVRISDWRIEK